MTSALTDRKRARLRGGAGLLLSILCVGPAVSAQIQVDSTSDNAKSMGAVIAMVAGESVHSKLGNFVPVLSLQCRHHDEAMLTLFASIGAAIVVPHGPRLGEQTIEVQADSSKTVRLNMWVVREGLVAHYSDEVQKVLLQMTSTRRLAIRWKLWTFEQVVGSFPLYSTLSDRQTKLAAPWLSCHNKPLW